jgi:transposase
MLLPEQLSSRSPDVHLSDLLAVPIDVGKHTAMAKVVDFTGTSLVQPFEFPLDRVGADQLIHAVRSASTPTTVLVRVGLEAAGHYHLPLLGDVLPASWDLRVLNPAHVAEQRKSAGRRTVKTDRIDLEAITDLLLANRGHRATRSDPATAMLAGVVAQRQRRSLVRRMTIQQLTSQVDRCFPGLDAAISSVALTKSGRLVASELPDPARVARLGPARLQAFAKRRGVRMTLPHAERIVVAARRSIPAPGADVARKLLHEDLCVLELLERQIADADATIAAVLPQTPFGVLMTVPGWGCARVGSYAAAVGEPTRWPSAKQLYRAAGLTPRLYESAGRRRDGAISKEGSTPLRRAIVDLGIGLWHSEGHAKAKGRALRARGMPGGIVITAMANRANRIAFAMVRDQEVWSTDRWQD